MEERRLEQLLYGRYTALNDMMTLLTICLACPTCPLIYFRPTRSTIEAK